MATSCPATCTDIAAPKKCKLELKEGCECDTGYVRSGSECVPISECGCIIDGQPCGENEECIKIEDQFKCACINGTRRNQHQKCEVPVCGKPADIVFLLDSSSSVRKKNFRKVLSFVKKMVNSFDIGENKVRIGVLTYSSKRRNRICFNLNKYFTKQSIINKIDSLYYFSGTTRTDLALSKMERMMFTEANGDRSGVPNLGVVITDGRSTWSKRTKTAADNVHKKGIQMFAIGIGKTVDQKELEYIASKKEYVESIPDFDGLRKIFARFQILTCKGIDK